MGHLETMVGNKAAAYGVKLSRVEVVSAYPITPQTTIVQYISDFVASGELNAKFIGVESEMSAQISVQGASLAGARVFTATSGPGLLYMHHPMTHCMLPIVMAVVHRSGKSMQPDHTDLMAQRDSGWIQMYCENNQEVLDTCIMAYKVAEDERLNLPVAFGLDGYILSYTAEPVDVPDQAVVDGFLPPYKPKLSIDPSIPYEEWILDRRTFHGTQEGWINHHNKILGALKIIEEVDKEFERFFGRSYGGLMEEYNCEGADAVIVAMGTIASTARTVVDELRKEGKPVGLVKLKTFRPFPTDEFSRLSEKYHAIGVIDRNTSLGAGGIVLSEVRNALYDLEDRPKVIGFHAGLSGKEVQPKDVRRMAEKTLKATREDVEPQVEWI